MDSKSIFILFVSVIVCIIAAENCGEFTVSISSSSSSSNGLSVTIIIVDYSVGITNNAMMTYVSKIVDEINTEIFTDDEYKTYERNNSNSTDKSNIKSDNFKLNTVARQKEPFVTFNGNYSNNYFQFKINKVRSRRYRTD